MRTLLSVAATVLIALTVAVAVGTDTALGQSCSKQATHVVFEGTHKCLGQALRKLIFFELVRAQDRCDFNPVCDERAYGKIARRFDVPIKAVRAIALEGVTKGWPMPPPP